MKRDEARGAGGLPRGGPSAPVPLRSLAFWLFWIAPPVLLMAFIFWLGTDRASAEVTRSLLATLLARFLPALYARLGPDALAVLNIVLRKCGHFAGYALLGLLDARALQGLRGSVSRRGARAAWALALAWAALDEFHQSFAPARGASLADVALDAAGAATGVLLYCVLPWSLPRIRRS